MLDQHDRADAACGQLLLSTRLMAGLHYIKYVRGLSEKATEYDAAPDFIPIILSTSDKSRHFCRHFRGQINLGSTSTSTAQSQPQAVAPQLDTSLSALWPSLFHQSRPPISSLTRKPSLAMFRAPLVEALQPMPSQ